MMTRYETTNLKHVPRPAAEASGPNKSRPSLRRGVVSILVAGCLLIVAGRGQAEPTTDLQKVFAHRDLILAFQGKGSSVPFDAGVMREVFDRIPALREGRVVVCGNSSGSILAAYYSCMGITAETVERCNQALLHADISAVKKVQNPFMATGKLLRHQKTEIPHDALREYIATALGVADWKAAGSIREVIRRSTARPRHPVLIVAANREVLENRTDVDPLLGKDYKEFDPTNYSVSWKAEVYEYYKKHPERFTADNPGLRLGPTRYIGKACTFFVDQTMFDLLSQIPPEERIADLRLMLTPRDVAVAILASASEPTYFDPVLEPELQKLTVGTQLGDTGNTTRRVYCGGWMMMMPVQDVRRMLPAARVLGTSWIQTPYPGRQLLKAWYLVDPEVALRQNVWWADLELQMSPAVKNKIILSRNITAQEEYNAGLQTAREGLNADRGLPQFVGPPKHGGPAPRAIVPSAGLGDAVDATSGDPPRLKTLRGLGPLLPKP